MRATSFDGNMVVWITLGPIVGRAHVHEFVAHVRSIRAEVYIFLTLLHNAQAKMVNNDKHPDFSGFVPPR